MRHSSHKHDPSKSMVDANYNFKPNHYSSGRSGHNGAARPEIPMEADHRSARNGFGDVLLRHDGAAVEEAAGGEEFGVEQGGACGATN
jgi:hypothetical protein